LKKPLNFPNAKDTDDFKDIYNPNKGPNPGAYSQKNSDQKVEKVVADKKPEVKKIAEPTKATAATTVATPAPTPLDKSKAPRANIPEVLATPATAVAQVAKKGPEEDAEARKKHVTEVQKTLTAKVFNNTPNAP